MPLGDDGKEAAEMIERAAIELHGAKTGNCLRAAIALEEVSIPYQAVHLDLRRGEHREAAHRRLNPAGKVPTLVDRTRDGPPFVLSQSNAILFYAASKAPGRLLPEGDGADRVRAYERFFFFITDVIATSHAAFFLRPLGEANAAALLDRRALDGLRLAEDFARDTPFIAGERFTLADIAAVTIVLALESSLDWTELPRLRSWFDSVMARPAVGRGLRAFDEP